MGIKGTAPSSCPEHQSQCSEHVRCSAGVLSAPLLCRRRKDGSMSQTPQLLEFAQRYNLRAITIDDLAHYIQDTQEIGF